MKRIQVKFLLDTNLLKYNFKPRTEMSGFSNHVLKLPENIANQLIKEGRVVPYISEPKRFVNIILSSGKKETMSWGDYLKRRYKDKKSIKEVV